MILHVFLGSSAFRKRNSQNHNLKKLGRGDFFKKLLRPCSPRQKETPIPHSLIVQIILPTAFFRSCNAFHLQRFSVGVNVHRIHMHGLPRAIQVDCWKRKHMSILRPLILNYKTILPIFKTTAFVRDHTQIDTAV